MRNKEHFIDDPFKYLENDHKNVSALFKEMSETTERAAKGRADLCMELTTMLTQHSELEKNVLYPRLELLKDTRDITLEAYEEHKVVEALLEELNAADAAGEEWMAKMTVLKENVEHHVKEEENDMFKKARKALSKEEQDALCRDMERFLTSEVVLA